MRITRVFFDVFMGYGFEGLSKIAKNAKTSAEPGSVVCFVNKKSTSFKVMVDGQYITYYKNGNKRIPLDALRLLPERFGGTKMEFDAAVRKSLEKQLGIIPEGKIINYHKKGRSNAGMAISKAL